MVKHHIGLSNVLRVEVEEDVDQLDGSCDYRREKRMRKSWSVFKTEWCVR